jgi:hypothetical protein
MMRKTEGEAVETETMSVLRGRMDTTTETVDRHIRALEVVRMLVGVTVVVAARHMVLAMTFRGDGMTTIGTDLWTVVRSRREDGGGRRSVREVCAMTR